MWPIGFRDPIVGSNCLPWGADLAFFHPSHHRSNISIVLSSLQLLSTPSRPLSSITDKLARKISITTICMLQLLLLLNFQFLTVFASTREARASGECICIDVLHSTSVLHNKVILLKLLQPPSNLPLGILEIQQPAKSSMVRPNCERSVGMESLDSLYDS